MGLKQSSYEDGCPVVIAFVRIIQNTQLGLQDFRQLITVAWRPAKFSYDQARLAQELGPVTAQGTLYLCLKKNILNVKLY
jgi:hypothetical protein